MGISILESREGQKVMYCNTTDWAFGPVFNDDEDVDCFLEFAGSPDVRTLTDAQLDAKIGEWRTIMGEINEACQFKGNFIAPSAEFLNQLTDVVIGDIEPEDAPDFSDAFFEEAYYKGVRIDDALDAYYCINKAGDWINERANMIACGAE